MPRVVARSRTHPCRPRHRVRWWWHIGIALAIFSVLLIAARLALPSYLHSYVQRTLDQSSDYTGRIGDIDVHLWRGAYTIHDLKIVKNTHAVPVPFFEDDWVDLSLDLRALFHARARGKIVMDHPRLNFVQGPSEEDTQTGASEHWLGIINDLFPFRIDRAEAIEGEIHFAAFHKKPPVDVYLSHVQMVIANLTNIQDKLDPLIASVHARGVAMNSGDFEFGMSLDPESHLPTFDLAARLLNMDVRELNSLSLAYGDFDFEAGKFDFVLEVSAKDGHLDGYAKPLFRNVRVLSLRDIQGKDPLRVLWEALVGAVGTVFKNQPRDQFGTRLTLQGDLTNPRTSILEIVGNVLRNAFVRAYLPRLEGQVNPDVPELQIRPDLTQGESDESH